MMEVSIFNLMKCERFAEWDDGVPMPSWKKRYTFREGRMKRVTKEAKCHSRSTPRSTAHPRVRESTRES